MQQMVIDVAQIMRDIRASIIQEPNNADSIVLKGNIDLVGTDSTEVNRILSFVDNTRTATDEHLHIGARLPTFERFHSLFRKVLTLFARVLRKASGFITRDQIVVNRNMDACIKALVESDVEIYRQFILMGQTIQNRLATLEARQNDHYNAQDAIGLMQDQLATLEARQNDHYSAQNAFSSDLMYVHFENQFRGSEEDIKKRMSYYLNQYIANIVEDKENSLLLDLGSGRGEWLELLKENGYYAKGVDCNSAMVNACTRKELEVTCEYAYDYLRTLNSSSVLVVTAFQLIEHVNLRQLTELIAEIHRVLIQGGAMILETPNTLNIEVGSSSFWIDPTHKRPVHQEYLRFLATETGFRQSDIAYWKEDETTLWFNSVVGSDEETIGKSAMLRTLAESLKKSMYCSPDYALIAIK